MTEHMLDHTKGPSFTMDGPTPNYFETLSGIDTYLQYPPQSPFGVSDLGRKCRFRALLCCG